ncbi:lipase family protein [Aureivirga sp. CE67]|uniref:lipase family protein n=1 Tax=Aureivirga sp. CE67 TaxID=1788983 RepID=UPI0018CA207A|nr:hypothetical protein [Aureivirga sp. CE67]
MKSINYSLIIGLFFSLLSCDDSTTEDQTMDISSTESLTKPQEEERDEDLADLESLQVQTIDTKLMMTFAAIGDFINQHPFSEEKAVKTYLERTDIETKNQWSFKWFATNRLHGISAYFTQNKTDKKIYTLTFAGTDLTNIFEVADIFKLDETLAFSEDHPDLHISKGAKELFEIAMTLSDQGYSVEDYIQNIYLNNPDAKIYIASHSLGTTFSVLFSATVYEQFQANNQNIDMEVWLFGHPTFYSQSFVNYYLNLPFKKNFYSLENDQVHTRFFWNFEELYNIPYPITEHLKSELIHLGEELHSESVIGLNQYSPLPATLVTNEAPLNSFIKESTLKNILEYLEFVEYNHNRNHYLHTFGGNCVPENYNAPNGNHCKN